MRIEVQFAQDCQLDLGERTPDRRALLLEYIRFIRELFLEHRGTLPTAEPIEGRPNQYLYEEEHWRIIYSSEITRGWFSVRRIRIQIHSIELIEEETQ
jgi:hypothetical protein